MSKKQQSKSHKIKAPVVTIMGHVDHGKTTLLDFIRKSRVAAKEAGGITQHIGAYQVNHNDQPITFIDTPGHAAFSKMRAHGAKITNIVVLVIAADDGIKPQTKEAIKLIKQGDIPVVVAINKMDVKGASAEMVKAQLIENEIFVEGYGGNVPVVEIVAREGKNIDQLLETIQLLAELEEIEADPATPVEAVVIEAGLSKSLGPNATLLVNTGTLSIGDELVSLDEPEIGVRIKNITSDIGKNLKQALPTQPVRVIGFKEVPSVGQVFTTSGQKQVVLAQQESEADEAAESEDSDSSADEEKAIKIILLTDTQGSLEAIQQNLGQEVQVLEAKTGQVTESDVLMAHSTGAVIVAFNVGINNSAKRLAEIEKVTIKEYKIIYELLEEFEQKVLKFLEPTIDETETGLAKVKAVFNIKGDEIAGCVVTSGILRINDLVHVVREDNIVADGKIASLKQGKVDVDSVETDKECGVVIKPAAKVQENDRIQAYTKE